MSGSTLICISLGSNIDPEHHTCRALNTLQEWLLKPVTSPIYRSPAVGMQGADFYNAVISGYTPESLENIRSHLLSIEQQHGRVRTENKFTDRPLDLDLLLFGNRISQGLPHKDTATQAYVLQPLTDIAPALMHPVLKLTMRELNDQLRQRHPDKYRALTLVTQ